MMRARVRHLALFGALVAACPAIPDDSSQSTATTTTTTTGGTASSGEDSSPTSSSVSSHSIDDCFCFPDPRPQGCWANEPCNLLDVLLVIDNSDGMAAEQAVLVASFPRLIDRLRGLVDVDGEPVNANVQIMVTTTDVGHPLCEPLEKPDYDPAGGMPISTACVDRLARFTSIDGTVVAPELCTDHCNADHPAAPGDPFIVLDPAYNNVMGADPNGPDPVVQAMQCIGPQGVDGCGMEAPLEGMIQGLSWENPWNQGVGSFVRKNAALAIIIVTDEADCSVKDPLYFDPLLKDDPEYSKYWENDPVTMAKIAPTSAVCFNAGVDCEDADADGVYESCMSVDHGVLHPVSRYAGFLKNILVESQGKDVFMLALVGIPPTGAADLVYRAWTPEDIAPGDPETPADKEYEFGIGPGCDHELTGPALPNTRVMDVCRALDRADDPDTPHDETRTRCCLASLCDSSYDAAFDCLADLLPSVLKNSS